MTALQALAEPAADDFDPFADGGVERVLSTSEAQREVWLADRLGSDASRAFNESVSLRLRGALDVRALQAALEALVHRHALLRATLGPDGSELLVGPAAAVPLPVSDLRTQPAAAAAQAVSAATARAVELPFSLEQGPLLRAELLRLADDEAVLLLTAHHIVCDGWSWGVIGEDLGALYTENLGEGPGLESGDDYADYVAWERGQMSDSVRGALERYWLGRFAGGEVPVLDLPTDRPRPPQRSFASRRIDHVLPAATVQAVQRSAAQAGVSLFAALLAGFAATLQRVAGQDDVVIGVPSAGQATSGLPRLVGHCVNLLPVRLAVDPAQSAEALMQQAGSTVLDAFDHAAMTYGSLLSCLPIARDPSRLPLVSVMFNLDQATRSQLDGFHGLDVTLSGNPRHFENFELFINAVRLDDGALRLECQYNTDLFDGATVARWLRCYETLLAAIAAGAGHSLSRLAMLAPEDLAALHALQPAREAQAWAGLMHEAFTARCRTHADAPAVRCGSQALSYAELDAQSNRLAHALRARGIGRGQRVGLCLPRGTDMLAALLGVLKSGAAYVPLDPAFPQARLDYYAEDAALALLITNATVPQVPTHWRPDAAQRLLVLDRDETWRQLPGTPHVAGPLDAGPDDAAYVIYTSGSTGRPKGVVVPHRAAANFLAAMQQAPGLVEGDRLAAVTTLSFDIAVLELLLPLSVGASVEIVPKDTVTDGPGLLALLAHSGATVMQATPGLWRMLVEAGWTGRPGFRALVGGESLPPDLAQDLLQRCTEVWNLYGPTETTVWSTIWRVRPGQPVSIGRPIRHTSVWALDAQGLPCPVGVPGELCIGGDGVALGYLDRPELTAERFVPDPFSPLPGARLYRTGDRGRWRNDGLLEHLGRLDFQVKVRGYRIELGEIEAACNAAPGVSECAVLAREDEPGDRRLVAYLVAQPGLQLDLGALREGLRRQLPDYMLPQHMMVLPALPRLPNGKLDRRALPAPLAMPTSEGVRMAPRTEREAQVLALMQEVLRLSGLGLQDDFFALGGHSLLGARLITRLNRSFGTALSLRALFEAPTAERLAAAVDGAQGRNDSALPVLQHDPARRSAALTPMQERIRFVEEMYPGGAAYNTPSAHRLQGPIDVPAFERAFQRLLERQPALRCVVARAPDGGWQLEVRDDLAVPMPVHDWRGLSAADREERLQAELQALATRPFDLTRGPLLRSALYRLEDELSVWGFVPHHIVWDGWSFDAMYGEMAGLYAAQVGDAPEPSPPPFSALDYAEGYNQWLAGDGARQQRDWWRTRFDQVPMPASMPTDRVRRGGNMGHGGSHALRMGADDLQALRQAARACGVTVNMLALTVLAALLSSLTGTESVVIGVPVRGREGGELERTLGFFNNLLPVPLRTEAGARLGEAATAVKRELLEAMAHQQVPFEWLSALPEVTRRATAAGLYQAAFSYQDVRERELLWGLLEHHRIPLFQHSVTEELSFWLAELDDGLVGAVHYRDDVYSEEAAAALRDRYLELLQHAGRGGEQGMSDLLQTGPSVAAQRLRALQAQSQALDQAQQQVQVARGARAPAPTLRGPEADVAALWAELLAVEVAEIRAEDNFFDLGGDSITAMRAVEAGAERFGVRIDARRYIYESLAQIAATAASGTQVAVAPPSAPGRLGRLFAALGRKRAS